jgi:hypothetical protein
MSLIRRIHLFLADHLADLLAGQSSRVSSSSSHLRLKIGYGRTQLYAQECDDQRKNVAHLAIEVCQQIAG